MALGLAESDLASVLGVGQAQMQAYERGTERVPAEHLVRLSEYFGVPLGYFFPVTPCSGSAA